MIIVWGKVEKYDRQPSMHVISWEECSRECLEQADCMIIESRNSECLLFEFGAAPTVLKTNATDGGIVGFKRVLNTCPADGSLAPIFTETDGEGFLETYKSVFLAYELKITSGIQEVGGQFRWKISENYFIQCPPNSLMSFRGAYKVCISLALFDEPKCQEYENATKVCLDSGAIGLSGPSSKEEQNELAEYILPKIKATPTKHNYGHYFFYTDGRREASETEFKMTDGTLNVADYTWCDPNEKAGEGNLCCFFWMQRRLEKICMDFLKCENDRGDGMPHYCFRGSVCKSNPVKQL